MRNFSMSQRNSPIRALAPALIIAVAIGAPAASVAAPSDMAKAQQNILKAGLYLAPDDSFRVAVPAELGKERWMREYHHVTEQYEVQFGDDQCRRYYVKKFAGAVGRAVTEDYVAKGNETTLRDVVMQLAAQRREDIESVGVRSSKYGPAVVATSVTKRGWPCVTPFPEGGSTIAVAWYFVQQGALYEAGYQASRSPGDDAGQSQANAGQRADAFVLGLEMLDTASKPRFPFTAGNPPPRLAGLTLGDTRAAVEKVVGPVESEDGDWEFKDKQRGLNVNGSDEKGVELLGIARREDGEVAGVRVGDRINDVIARWGEASNQRDRSGRGWPCSSIPPGRGVSRSWCTRDNVSYLGLGPVHRAQGIRARGVAARQAPRKASRDIRRVAKLPSEGEVHVGQCYELPDSALENHSGDSVHQDDPNIAVRIVDVVASPARTAGLSQSAVDALKKLLGSGPVMLEIVGVYTMGEFSRFVDARVSVGGQDVASAMVREGWAIAAKGRNSDLALLSLEAQSRAAKRGLWSINPAELGGGSPENYLREAAFDLDLARDVLEDRSDRDATAGTEVNRSLLEILEEPAKPKLPTSRPRTDPD